MKSHIKKIRAIFFIYALVPVLFFSHSQAQTQGPYFIFDQSTKVFNQSNTELLRAWCGGFRSPQFSEIDANLDGVNDLFVFDRYDNTVSVFLKLGSEYVYAPDYEYYFPPLTRWALLKDYNCDGKNDIFVSRFGGIQVYENISSGGKLKFQETTSYLTGADGPVVVFEGDIPVIDDIDGDGDIDILAFGATGVYVTHHKNMSVENGNGCSDLEFEIYTQCWGHFRENASNSDIIMGDDCGGNIPPTDSSNFPEAVMHIGSTILAYDHNGNGIKDLLIGDISSENMKLLINGGTAADAEITSVSNFTSANPVDMYVFPAAYLIDIDNDGDKDILVSPNDGSESAGRNYNNIWLYRNTGNSTTQNYVFEKENFLSDKALEFGSSPSPAFFDFDNDGDFDLVVGNYYKRLSPTENISSLVLYENIGTSENPVFKEKDDDYAGFKTTGLSSLSPAFGDLDLDGDIDMIVGDFEGKFHLVRNTAGVGNTASFNIEALNYLGLDVGNHASPFLVDLDRDGDLDMLVGERNGNINYFENTGLVGNNPQFVQITDSVGKIDTRNPLYAVGYSAPYITQLDSNSNYDLVVGSFDGIVQIYLNIENYDKIDDVYQVNINTYYNIEAQNYTDIDFGFRVKPALADLDGDALPEMIVGLYKGGLYYLKNNSDTILKPNDIYVLESHNQGFFKIFPNPTEGSFSINSNIILTSVKITDLLGREIETISLSDKKSTFNVQTNLEKGIYILFAFKDEKIVSKSKLVVLDK